MPPLGAPIVSNLIVPTAFASRYRLGPNAGKSLASNLLINAIAPSLTSSGEYQGVRRISPSMTAFAGIFVNVSFSTCTRVGLREDGERNPYSYSFGCGG